MQRSLRIETLDAPQIDMGQALGAELAASRSSATASSRGAKAMSSSAAGSGPDRAALRTNRSRCGRAAPPGQHGIPVRSRRAASHRAALCAARRAARTASPCAAPVLRGQRALGCVSSTCTSFSASAKVAGPTSGPTAGAVPNAGGEPGGGAGALGAAGFGSLCATATEDPRTAAHEDRRNSRRSTARDNIVTPLTASCSQALRIAWRDHARRSSARALRAPRPARRAQRTCRV